MGDSIQVDGLIEILSASLGQEKSRHVVLGAVDALGIPRRGTISGDQCERILERVGEEGGLVLAATRIARLRIQTEV